MAPKAKTKSATESKEGKPKKPKAEAGGFDLWGSTDGNQEDYFQAESKEKLKPQDKRDKEKAKESGPVMIKASESIAAVISKTKKTVNEADKEKVKEKLAKEEKRKGGGKKAIDSDDDDDQRDKEKFEVMDKLGNFLDQMDVLNMMNNAVTEASTSSGRCQASVKTRRGDKVFHNAETKFASMGDLTFNKGFIYLRPPLEKGGVEYKLRLSRPCTAWVCLSQQKDDQPYLGTWKVVKDDVDIPEFSGKDGVEEIVEIRKKVLKDRYLDVPRPPPGIATVVLFIQPDFFAEPFGEEELSAEEIAAQEKADAAARRSAREASKVVKDEESPEKKLAAVLAKVEAGEKLSNKDKKLYEKHLESTKEMKSAEDELCEKGTLNAFNLILEGGKCVHPPAGDAIVCDNFSITAPKQTLFDNTTLKIAYGKRYGLLGPNGHGKTTLVRHLAAREMPIPLNWDVQLVEQEAKASERSAVEEVLSSDERIPKLLAEEQELLDEISKQEEGAAEDLWGEAEWEKARTRLENITGELEAVGADTAEARVRKILCGLGFTIGDPKTDRFSMENAVVKFSGGWRMRISLAKALFLQPKLLLLDEPTNHLDLDAVLWLDHYLAEEYPHSMLVISHDADFLDSVCTDMVHLENKKLNYYRGGYSDFRKMHAQMKGSAAKEYKLQQDMLKDLKKKGKTKDQAIEMVKAKFGIQALDDLNEKPKDYVVQFKFQGLGQDRSLGGINMSEVAFSYTGQKPYLLDEIDMGVDCCTRLSIVGPNGVGKTTLLSLMLGKLEPLEGEVQQAKGIRVREYNQHFEELLPLEKDPVEFLMNEYNLSPPEKARAMLGSFGLPGASHLTKIGYLSGGQKARVAFAALCAANPHIIVLDEPTNHLDIESVEALIDAIQNYNGGVILVSHDARLIETIDCDIWVCEAGTCYRYEKGFKGYKDRILRDVAEREEAIEKLAAKKAAERAAAREKHMRKDKDGNVIRATPKPAAAPAAAPVAETPAAPVKSDKAKKKEAEKMEAEKAKTEAKAKAEAPKKDKVKDDEEVLEEEEKEEEPKKKKKKKQEEEEEYEYAEEEEEEKPKKKKKKKHEEEEEEYVYYEEEEEKPKKKKKKKYEEEEEEYVYEEEEEKPKKKKKKKYEEEEEEYVYVEEEEEKPKKKKKKQVEEEEEEVEEEVPKKNDKAKSKKKAVKDEEEQEEEEEAPKKKEKASAKTNGKKADTSHVEEEEAETEEKPTKKNEKSKDLDFKPPARDAEPAEKAEAQDEDVDDGKHKAYLVAQVASAEAMKKKGNFLVELSIGDDKPKLNIVTSFAVEEGQRVIVAPEGATVNGKPVKTGKVAGEFNEGIIISPAEMPDFPGDKKEHIVLPESCTIGDRAPLCPPGATPQAQAKGDEQESKKAGKKQESAAKSDASEFMVGQVVSSHAMKKLKGRYLSSISIGEDKDELSIVHNYANVEAGQLVIVAPVGSTVNGKKVEATKQGGEGGDGMILGPAELEWPGKKDACVVLEGDYKVGDPPPAEAPEKAEEDGEAEEGEEELFGKKKAAAKPKAKFQSKAAAKSKGKKGKDDDEEEEEDDLPKGKKGKAAASKAKGKKGKHDESDDDAEEEEEDDDAPKGKKGKVAASKAKGKKGKQDEDEEEEDDDEDDAPKGKKGKATKAAKAKGKKGKQDDEDDEDEDDDEDDGPKGKKGKAAAKQKGKKGKQDDEDEEDEDDDEDDGPKGKKGKAAAKQKGKKGKQEDDDEDEEDEDDAPKAKKGKAAKAAPKAKGKKDDDEEDDDWENEDKKKKGKRGKK